MLEVSKEQLDVLGQRRLPAHFEAMRTYLCREFPLIASEKDPELQHWIEEAYYEAKSYGFSTQREHARFINYKCLFGERFVDEYDFVKPILISDMSVGKKLSMLKDGFISELRKGR